MVLNPIFTTSLARSGGGVFNFCLSAHPHMTVAHSPNLELFRSFRNAVIREYSLQHAFSPSDSLSDYYGSEARIALLDAMIESSLDIPFDDSEWDVFLERSKRRGSFETPDLAAHYDSLRGCKTYREIFERFLIIIAKTRNSADSDWVGFHEPWIIDTFPALARAFPNARFLVILRDPRATINSNLNSDDPEEVGQLLSYARHWRKYVALTRLFCSMPLFKNRIYVTAHDLLVSSPQLVLEKLCHAFNTEMHPNMLDTDMFLNPATGMAWTGNSSFEKTTRGIQRNAALRWRDTLSPTLVKTVEYLCGSDMRYVGYSPLTQSAEPQYAPDPDIVNYLLLGNTNYANWRSDLGDPLLDLGLEAVRRQLLTLEVAPNDVSLIRKTFLFEDMYAGLLNQDGPLLPDLHNFFSL